MGKPIGEINPKAEFVLGVDFAHLGSDNTVFIVIERPYGDEEHLYVVYIEETSKMLLTDAIGRVKILNSKFNFRKIICDYTGLGIGAVDSLKEQLGFIVEGVRFTVQSKMDIYGNLKILFQKKKLKIPNHKKLIYQLADLRYEVIGGQKGSGQIKIHHSPKGKDDFADACALAAWHFKPGFQTYEFPLG